MVYGQLIFSTGSGIYVERSRYIRNQAVTNNSLIVRGTSSSYYLNAHCYSNSTMGRTAYFRFPDGSLRSSDSDHYDYSISQLSYTGVQIYRRSREDIFGIFTCKVPDSRGITVETSIGIYASMPSEF